MKIKDRATGNIYNIANYDGEPGAPDYMGDIIGNSGDVGIHYDDYEGEYISDMDTIQWWLDYCEGMRDMTQRQEELLSALADIDPDDIDTGDYCVSIAEDILAAQGVDYDQHASSSILAMQDWIDEHVSDAVDKTTLLALLD